MSTNNTVKRPVLRYFGGKWRLAPWIISHMPAHRVYVEPFGGAASVLLRKERSHAEIYNDLDGEIVNLFRVLRDPATAGRLVELVTLTPFARDEFDLSYEACDDPVEQARRTVYRSFAGFGSGAASGHKTGFRNDSNRSNTTPAHDWANFPKALPGIIDRLAGVVVENKDYVDLVRKFDSRDALIYVDPPYPGETRGNKGHYSGVYKHEMMDTDQHAELAALLHIVSGKVMISGYPCDLYDVELYPDWRRVERDALADGAGKRTEVLWMNFEPDALPLFEAIK